MKNFTKKLTLVVAFASCTPTLPTDGYHTQPIYDFVCRVKNGNEKDIATVAIVGAGIIATIGLICYLTTPAKAPSKPVQNTAITLEPTIIIKETSCSVLDAPCSLAG